MRKQQHMTKSLAVPMAQKLRADRSRRVSTADSHWRSCWHTLKALGARVPAERDDAGSHRRQCDKPQ
jgi:hypothetical protein